MVSNVGEFQIIGLKHGDEANHQRVRVIRFGREIWGRMVAVCGKEDGRSGALLSTAASRLVVACEAKEDSNAASGPTHIIPVSEVINGDVVIDLQAQQPLTGAEQFSIAPPNFAATDGTFGARQTETAGQTETLFS